MRTERITDLEVNINKFERFFSQVPFGRFMSDRKLEFSCSLKLEISNLIKYYEKGNLIVVYDNNDEIVGLIGYHFSQWDTEVFLEKMAIVQYFLVKEFDYNSEVAIANELLNQFHSWVSQNQIKVVITKLDTKYFTPVLILQQNGYILFECITYRSVDVDANLSKINSGVNFRYSRPSDNEKLKEISLRNTFEKSHFYLDKNFEKQRIDLMYAKWIETAINTNQKIVIVEESEKIAGVFIYDVVDYTQTFNKKIGVWKSAFVDGSFRDKGIGLSLFKATLQSCINDNVDIVDSSLVEKNIVSQSFHDKLGFRLVNTQYTFHKWFK